MTREDMLRHVLSWADRDIGTIPLLYKGKKSLVKWKVWAGRCPPKPILLKWFLRKHPCNLGLLLRNSPESSLIVLDFDSVSEYVFWRHRFPTVAKSYTVATSRGRHVYLRSETPVLRTQAMKGGEVKATGYVVAPPSVHPTGDLYSALNENQILTVDSLESIGIEQEEFTEAPDEDQDFEITPGYGNGETTVQRVKNGIPILSFLHRIADVRPGPGNTWFAVCPFHKDTNPSLQIWPDEDRCYCHSPKCRAHKRCDVIDCAELHYRMSTFDAIRMLASEL